MQRPFLDGVQERFRPEPSTREQDGDDLGGQRYFDGRSNARAPEGRRGESSGGR